MNWDSFREERRKRGKPFVVAHRGVAALEPENTLPSFALALEQGADALETDLRFTSDAEIVLFHDETVERMTDGQGKVSDYTLAQLRQLHTRRPDTDEPTGPPIPTLEELLQQTQSGIPLLLELKDPLFAQQEYAERLIRLLNAQSALQRSAIASFQMELAQGVKQVEPDIPSGYITYFNPWPRRDAEMLGPAWPILYLNPFYVWLAHRTGRIVAPLDPNPVPRLSYYLRRGVDALLADNPAEVVHALENVS